ncbi:HlyD family efflux transporter periplasmic adaptor subunit [Synechococcus sp. HK05]|uniref:HlyD family secretion protein n=1 Tax=Synechococcus sp. HK05 TaxID=2725975 RepID=UPI001C382A45|nr:HlyD family efflux transporter periplasmic adaptor subunit [Synechococcus sp. HK05]MBV2352143.1 HlyD family efflux transporter periplasmic adaptor subunit [Synechococcus sp. HK05]
MRSLLNKPASLFTRAQKKLESSIQPNDQDEKVLNQHTFWMRSLTWTLVGTTAFALAWLAFAKTEEIVQATGRLQPIGSVKDIQLPLGGVTKQILVKDGEQVKAGQPLLELDTEANKAKQISLISSIQLKQAQLESKLDETKRSEQLNAKTATILRERLRLDQEVLSRYEKLEKEGAAAELQYLQQKNKVTETRGQLEQTILDGERQRAIQLQGLKQLSAELESLKSQLAEANQSLRYQVIKAPVDGVVFDLKPKSTGFAAQSTEIVMRIVPYDKLEARVEIPTEDIGFVRVGMPADVSIDSFPATDFGVLEGTVIKIGSDALPPDPSKQREIYRYPASIRLANQQLKLKSGRTLPLQVGMSLVASIKLRDVTYLQLLLGGFRDKADALRRI